MILVLETSSPPLPGEPPIDLSGLREHLAANGNFALASEWRDPQGGKIVAQIWQRTSSAGPETNVVSQVHAGP